MSFKQFLTKVFGNKKVEEVAQEPEPEIPEVSQAPVSETGRGYLIRTTKSGKQIFADKYSEEEKLFIVTCIGQMMSPMEISEAFYNAYKLKLDSPNALINNYKKADKWKPIIKKVRDHYLKDMESVPSFHKRVRLERVEKVYDKAVQNGDLKNSLSAMKHAREEVEEKSAVNNFELTLNQYNVMTDEELEARRNEVLKYVVTVKPKEQLNGPSGESGQDISSKG